MTGEHVVPDMLVAHYLTSLTLAPTDSLEYGQMEVIQIYKGAGDIKTNDPTTSDGKKKVDDHAASRELKERLDALKGPVPDPRRPPSRASRSPATWRTTPTRRSPRHSVRRRTWPSRGR